MEIPDIKRTDGQVPCAITDGALNILHANPAFYDRMGKQVFHSAFVLFTDDSIDGIKCALKSLDKGERIKLPVSLDEEGGQMPALLTLRRRDDGNVDVALYELYHMFEMFEDNAFRMRQYRAWMTMEGDAFFEYHGGRDEFQLYWLNNEQNIYFYNGSFSQWMQEKITSGDIDDADLTIFMDFCWDLQNHTKKFNYQIRNRIITKDKSLETSRIMGRTMEDMEGDSISVGIWNLYNESTGTKQDQLLKEIYMDPATGIMTKQDIIKYATKLLDRKPDHSVALCVVDLDNFKGVNDNYGHLFGDAVLKEVSRVLRRSVGLKGVAGRIGGDEFLMVLENVENELELKNILRAVRSGIAWIYPDKLNPVHFGCSMGTAMYPKNGNQYKRLFHIADNALYLAKATGKNKYIIYDENMHGIVDEGSSSLCLVKTVFHQADTLDVGTALGRLLSEGESGIRVFLSQFIRMYLLDRIQIFKHGQTEPLYSVCGDGMSSAPAPYIDHSHYETLFQGRKYFSLTHVHQLEYSEPDIYHSLLQQGMETIYQYRCGEEGIIRGVISLEICKKPMHWSEETLSIFTLICAAIEQIIWLK